MKQDFKQQVSFRGTCPAAKNPMLRGFAPGQQLAHKEPQRSHGEPQRYLSIPLRSSAVLCGPKI